MPGATTGRPRGRPRKNPAAPPATADISCFTRVSKHTTATGQEVTDKKIIKTVEDHDVTTTPATPSVRKRKAARTPEPEEVATTHAQRQVLGVTTKSAKKQKRLQAQAQAQTPSEAIPRSFPEQSPSTPRRTTKKRALSPEIESPRTKEAGSLFKRLRIATSPAFARRPSPLTTTQASTPATSVIPDSEDEHDEFSAATTPEPEPKAVQALPQELLDVVSLYTAFLKTVTVHYAHNGTNTPVDLRQISQPVSLAWGKRRISLADIRRCVGIMDVESSATKSPFYLVDYGNKKTCVEIRDEHRGRPLDERGLVSVFEANLRGIWETVRGAAADDMNAFVLGLPKAPVQSCAALTKASSMLAKGQRAMEELKAGIAARKEEKKEATRAASNTTSNTPSGDGVPPVKLSLLDRLRLKETHLAQLAATGPTPADLERRAALQRADDVSAVIAMLAKASPGSGMRVSFTMATLLQRLKDSLRLPISKEEGAACIRLLAKEVAPEWLKIVVAAGKENVVVQIGKAPSSGAVVEKVRMLSGKKGGGVLLG